MNIENKIRFKAAGLYLIAGISAVAMVIFLYNVRSNINSQRIEAEKQHRVLIFTNDLIYAVGQAQASVSFFVSTRNEKYIKDFQVKLIYINSLIDTLSVIEPLEKENLQQIKVLLARQTSNVSELNRLLDDENPLTPISERIQQYKPQQNATSHVVTIRHDTVYKPSKEKKNFFRRLKDVFSPGKNTTMVVSNIRVDTIKVGNSTPSPFLSEVRSLAFSASKRYDQNIRAIEQQVANQIMSDREISAQIAGLLLELHKQTLNSMLDTIERNEQSINRNYTLSVIGGIIALGLILLFILLIIYDVNKGKEAREKLRQVMESRHKLLLSVSHDIKSPLGSILGYLELHRQQGEDVKSMQNSARHILALLENLLEYSSLEQGSLQLTSTTFSLEELSDEIGQMFLPLAEAKHISFTFSSDKIRIISDQMKIKQIIINLVSNAIKYTRIGEIKLATTYVNQQLRIEVKDTGAGIPEDKLEEIYEPFSRVESNNTLAHGTGLGMYVVKGLIELLTGSIQLISTVGKGTSVTVTIPCVKAESIIKQGSKRIAVFDDDPVIVKMAGEMLSRLGHVVIEKDYDVILTDMEMGELSGNDILASAGNIPVIVMTGHSDFTIEKALQLGFAGFLQKPFTMESLREIFGEGEKGNDGFLEEDEDEIRGLFRTSTAENYAILRQALADADFNKAQATCHKMLPMFVLLGYPVDALRRMDARRGNAYEGWEKDVETILTIKI
ncbi:ATP-binding response regulator [Microbacter margulisiae]|uniref:histidine kinase n=1 Tax=Microbacter margulisiae TaxID=1350067 RepID=A0A7W5DST8_9PORP|nr:HAMP domain-containing sensor histidine kinase [Microbacter margulisiae]MBB3187944.1 signal transduction histidine kinase/CheY-like chemotaxis protein [Microbacter margulisiae]